MTRTCPSCGAAERRWTVAGVDYVNLSPLTGACVDCNAALAKEMGPPPAQVDLFDPKAAAANDREDA